MTGPGAPRDRITGVIADLDATIRQIRTSVFQLQRTPDGAAGVRTRILEVAAEVAPALGSEPVLRFGGLLEGLLAPGLVDDLLAVLREALSNVARHARARTCEVDVVVEDGRLVLEVSDDGIGPASGGRRSGLVNLRRRAERHGGTFTVEPGRPAGTRLRWTVPL